MPFQKRFLAECFGFSFGPGSEKLSPLAKRPQIDVKLMGFRVLVF
jgi:hypothetical protein